MAKTILAKKYDLRTNQNTNFGSNFLTKDLADHCSSYGSYFRTILLVELLKGSMPLAAAVKIEECALIK